MFPSIKEGWGLVVLEAMASGLPVLTSNRVPFTEFLSDQDAVLVNPNEVDDIATGMLAMTDSGYQLSPHPDQILGRYTWQKSAQMHLDLYYQMIDG